MTQSEHAEIVRRESEGSVLLGIDRPYARKFYTDVPLRVVEEQTGEAPYFEKMVTYACFLGSPIALFVSGYFAVVALGWWSALVIPASFFTWFFYSSRSAVGTTRLVGISLIVAAVVALHLFQPDVRRFTPFLFCFTLALWLQRLLYVGATVFLRSFIIRNHRAFIFVQDYVTVRSA